MFQALNTLNAMQSAMAPQPTMQGWLTKLGYKSGKWQRRYFTLMNNVISYANDASSAEKGQIVLDTSATCEVLAPGSSISQDALSPSAKPKSPIGANAFQVTANWKGVGKRAFVMFAETAGERDSWIAAINSTISNPATHVGAPKSPTPASGFDSLGGLGNALAMAQQAKGLSAMAAAPAGHAAYAAPAPAAAAPAASAIKSASGKSIPAFPKTTEQALFGGSGGQANLMDMMKTAGAAMSAMKAHQANPHLSQQDNAIALAQSLKGATGMTQAEDGRLQALRSLEALLPAGYCGFVVTEPPGPGTLAQQHGLQTYDLIFGFEGERVGPSTTQQQFSEAKTRAFQSKGCFSINVYNFVSETEREVNIMMPPGTPNAILGIVSSMLPVNLSAGAAGPVSTAGLVTKGWIKSGGMYISSGANAYPIDGPCTPDNAEIYVKIARQQSGMMISTGDYHPLYNYTQLSEQLYVEAWQVHGSMLVQSGNKYAPLPMTREHISG